MQCITPWYDMPSPWMHLLSFGGSIGTWSRPSRPNGNFFLDVNDPQDQSCNDKRGHFLANYPLAIILIIFLFQIRNHWDGRLIQMLTRLISLNDFGTLLLCKHCAADTGQ